MGKYEIVDTSSRLKAAQTKKTFYGFEISKRYYTNKALPYFVRWENVTRATAERLPEHDIQFFLIRAHRL